METVRENGGAGLFAQRTHRDVRARQRQDIDPNGNLST